MEEGVHRERSYTLLQRRWVPLAPGDRLALLGMAVGFVCLVLVAWWLTPDPRGLGTHEQLGLPPCTSQTWFHIPCPFCGMTTAFSLMAHGRVVEAIRAQPAGALMFALGIPLTGAAAFLAVAGATPAGISAIVRKPFWLIGLGVLVASWVYKVVATLW